MTAIYHWCELNISPDNPQEFHVILTHLNKKSLITVVSKIRVMAINLMPTEIHKFSGGFDILENAILGLNIIPLTNHC